MALEGLQAVHTRIGEIQGRIGTTMPAGGSAPAVQFADVLSAVSAPTRGYPTGRTATVRAPGAYGPFAPPPELAAYGNGRVPLSELVTIGDGSERLYAPAAEAFRRMASDAWRAGVDLKVNDGYRSFAEQQSLAAELGLYRDGGKAAVPGTSTHGWGLSVDVDTDGGAAEWLRANAARYGFVEDVRGEPWHWTFRPD
jgi:zinc D-Ala-D-Ala carboxypeptidase